MSKFLYHSSCDVCGSKDNKAVYEDGSTYCFGCKTATRGTINLREVFHPTPTNPQVLKEFPYDAQDGFPVNAFKWLLQYGLTSRECDKFGIKWSPSRQMICWKVKNPMGTIIGWQGRNFNPQAKSKYTSYGAIHKDLCLLGDKTDKLVLVEDYISAIKVSSHSSCMPLFGCTINLEGLQAISKRFKGVIVWLDSDKLENARKIALNANLAGITGQVLFTEQDPKCYEKDEITGFLSLLDLGA